MRHSNEGGVRLPTQADPGGSGRSRHRHEGKYRRRLAPWLVRWRVPKTNPVPSPRIPCVFTSRLAALIAGFLFLAVGHAQETPEQAQGLKEELISVPLSGTRIQAGVYSVKAGADRPTHLAVLLPGSPSVVRPVVENGVMTRSKLSGNFLIRARRHLVDENIASLVVDCHSESGDQCAVSYQASKQRQEDVDKLIAEVRARHPSIQNVWLVGTSLGTVSSSFMPLHNPRGYAGAIHTATITDPNTWRAFRPQGDFDYKRSQVPQFFVHHAADPCGLTTYAEAKAIASRYDLPLVTVSGGSDFRGAPCAAFTAHGFRGKEREVMNALGAIIKSGRADQREVQ